LHFSALEAARLPVGRHRRGGHHRSGKRSRPDGVL